MSASGSGSTSLARPFEAQEPWHRAGLCLGFTSVSAVVVLGLWLAMLLRGDPAAALAEVPEEARGQLSLAAAEAMAAVLAGLLAALLVTAAGGVAAGWHTWRGSLAAARAGLAVTIVLGAAAAGLLLLGLLATAAAGSAGLVVAATAGGPAAVLAWQGALLMKAVARLPRRRRIVGGRAFAGPLVRVPAHPAELPPPGGRP